MLDPLQGLIDRVRELPKESPSYVRDAEKILEQALALRDRRTVPVLLSLLDDGAPFDELMFSIIHGAEGFDKEGYVKAVLPEVENLLARAPSWAEIVFIRILNSASARLQLASEAANADADVKQALRQVLGLIGKDPKFAEKVHSVLKAL